jgi:hypothetical protein
MQDNACHFSQDTQGAIRDSDKLFQQPGEMDQIDLQSALVCPRVESLPKQSHDQRADQHNYKRQQKDFVRLQPQRQLDCRRLK